MHVRSRDKIAKYLKLFRNIWGILDLKLFRNIGGIANLKLPRKIYRILSKYLHDRLAPSEVDCVHGYIPYTAKLSRGKTFAVGI